ncbi:MAG: MFS transporter [Alphaproteobacteria bacterium]|jgi:predicted MFS family arabinose efflux permease|nr:hypothetical protein [Rhodospirillaceae bacterium]MDP6406659.1 MFS transporter [Alphaproteobacteria bacterium]MDP6620789.1 MFS transporter [Alphaproteobacteria bacterium]|tara:strand:+ start:526 stop:1698 length:1173 start_codon:yes stop_codon:yes gene_type:complete
MPKIHTRWLVLIGAILGRLAFGFEFQSLAMVAPGISRDLAVDPTGIGVLVGLFMLPGVVLALPGGFLGQRFGERPILILGFALMIAGALICALAESYAGLFVGRLVAGVGGVLNTIFMSKLVIDWFAEHELNTAMAILLTGYPVGLALALSTLGYWATPEAWPLAQFTVAFVCLVSLGGFLASHRPAPVASQTTGSLRLSRREIGMVSLAGAIWALFNGAFIIMLSFVPGFLISVGYQSGTAGQLVSIVTWAAMVAVPLGGFAADRLGRPALIVVGGCLIWAGGLALIEPWSGSVLLLSVLFVITSLAAAPPSGPLVSLPAEVLEPSHRAAGMGLFYSWFYLGVTLAPMLAGASIEQTGDTAAPITLAVILVLVALCCFVTFRLLRRGQE